MSGPEPKGPSRADVVVVGGGLAGLTAAALAAREGRSVVLLEKSSELGGRAGTTVEEGYRLNLGPHALYPTGPGARILEDLGVWPEGGVPPRKGALGLVNGELHPLPADPGTTLSTGLLGFVGKLALGSARWRLHRADPGRLAGTDVSAWLRKLTRHRGARQLLEALVRLTTYSHDGGLAADAAAAKLKDGLEGVLYPDRGWRTLVDDLARTARDHGATIRTGARADGLVVEARRARGVRVGGEALEAGAVILAVPVSAAAELAGEHVPGLRLADRKKIPTRLATLDVGLRNLPEPDRTFVLGIDRPLYFSVHSAVAELAPEGGAVVHVSRYLGPHEHPDPREVEAELEELLDLAQPGWREVVAVRRFLPDMTVTSATPRGNEGGLPGRFRVRSTDVEELYLAGDWVGSVGLLSDCSLASAAEAAAWITGSGRRRSMA